jgi:hypothetical protein
MGRQKETHEVLIELKQLKYHLAKILHLIDHETRSCLRFQDKAWWEGARPKLKSPLKFS